MLAGRLAAANRQPRSPSHSFPQQRRPWNGRSCAGVTTVEYLVIAGVLVATLLVVFQVFATQSRSAMNRLGNCIAGAAGGADCSAGSGGFLDSVSRGAQTVSNTATRFQDAVSRGVRGVTNTATRYSDAANRAVTTGSRAVADTASRYWNATRNVVSQLAGG